MKRFCIIVIALFSIINGFSQESIKLMFYNLLNFNNYTSYCTSANNSHETKADYLSTIVGNQKPDILAVCEVGTNISASYSLNYILGNSLNKNGETKWRCANPSGSYLINGLFYDKTKFQLIAQPIVSTSIRDINIYKLKYLLSDSPIYFNIIIMHLKAGGTSSDEATRAAMVQNLMDYLQTTGNNENYVVVGDFNTTTSSEGAIQKLVNPSNPSLAFYDPINQLGAWNNNYNFRKYHTQSTRSAMDNDCFTGGGLDDRFDFILISSSIKDATAKIKYKDNSYWAVGQDGNRFNSSINYPTNTTLPTEVVEALFNMSDHLPVVADFYFGDQNNITSTSTDPHFYVNIINPTTEQLNYQLKTSYHKDILVNIYSITGTKVYETQIISEPNKSYTHDISHLPNGMYILEFLGEGIKQTIRVVKYN